MQLVNREKLRDDSIPEISRAFLTTEDTINKRLVRARQKIREANIPFIVPQEKELEKRIDAVLEVIYLLFNEGYSASVFLILFLAEQ